MDKGRNATVKERADGVERSTLLDTRVSVRGLHL